MKTLRLIAALIFVMTGLLPGQSYDKVPKPHLESINALRTGADKPPNPGIPFSAKGPWDIKLLGNMKSITGATDHAGIVYLTTTGNVWISRFNCDTLYLWTATTTNAVYYFTVPGVWGITAMTFDGTDVYAVNNTKDIFVINPDTRRFTGTIKAPQAISYITFDPGADNGNGGFWTGNYETNAQLISRSGSLLRTINYSDLGATGIYGAAYDGETLGGPYVWFFGQSGGYGTPQILSQVSPATGKATNLQHEMSSALENYAPIANMHVNADSMIAGGLCLVKGIFPGVATLGGIMQGEPDLIFLVETGFETAPPGTITINRSYTFGDPKVSSSYRILSLPGDVNIPLSQLFAGAGDQKKNWNAFYDNGKTENYLVEYDNSAAFTFRPGNAFWVVSKNQLNVSAQVNPVTTDALGLYEIPLHSGWNLISNPFNTEIAWASVKLANQLANNSLIYAWSGSWTNPSSLTPYEGYYFNNTGNLTSLYLTESIPVGISSSRLNKPVLPDKYIKGYLYSDGLELSPIYISFNNKSLNSFDEFDYFTPPSDFSDECIFILNNNLETDYKHLFIDSRPDISEGQVYDLALKNTLKKSFELRFEGMENFPGYEVYIADKHMKMFYNLRENPAISIEPKPVQQEFSLIIGKDSFIEENKGTMLPKDYALFQNYPNPFNPYTVISYEIPIESRVELKIFNVLGKEIITLIDGVEAPGRHEIKFEAGNLPSGVYFCTMKSNSFIKTEKMVLMK